MIERSLKQRALRSVQRGPGPVRGSYSGPLSANLVAGCTGAFRSYYAPVPEVATTENVPQPSAIIWEGGAPAMARSLHLFGLMPAVGSSQQQAQQALIAFKKQYNAISIRNYSLSLQYGTYDVRWRDVDGTLTVDTSFNASVCRAIILASRRILTPTSYASGQYDSHVLAGIYNYILHGVVRNPNPAPGISGSELAKYMYETRIQYVQNVWAAWSDPTFISTYCTAM